MEKLEGAVAHQGRPTGKGAGWAEDPVTLRECGTIFKITSAAKLVTDVSETLEVQFCIAADEKPYSLLGVKLRGLLDPFDIFCRFKEIFSSHPLIKSAMANHNADDQITRLAETIYGG